MCCVGMSQNSCLALDYHQQLAANCSAIIHQSMWSCKLLLTCLYTTHVQLQDMSSTVCILLRLVVTHMPRAIGGVFADMMLQSVALTLLSRCC